MAKAITKATAKGLSVEQHREFGKAIGEFRAKMFKVSYSYPKTSAQARTAWRIEKALLKLKSEMENALYKERPDLAKDPKFDLIGVYYGNDTGYSP